MVYEDFKNRVKFLSYSALFYEKNIKTREY